MESSLAPDAIWLGVLMSERRLRPGDDNKLDKYVSIKNKMKIDQPKLRPLHMSPVNRAGSVSEISPGHFFLRKNFDVFI